MLIVETIRKVRLSLLKDGDSQREVAKKYRMSRNTVRKIASSDQTEFHYTKRKTTVYPILGPHIESLKKILEKEEEMPQRKRRTGKKIVQELRNEGYEGSYDAVRRYIKSWKEEHKHSSPQAYVPLEFRKGEAFQFDFSEEMVELGGEKIKVHVAQLRLCYSRMRFCMAFPGEELSMVIEAHISGHDFLGGLCERGIYDNPKTIVTQIGRGKAREYNKKFLQCSSHYLFEVTACTPRSGWEKGQVERQVGVNRENVFIPCLKFADMKELNEHLKEQMLVEARNSRHPEIEGKSVYEVYEEEKPYLRRQDRAFDGYVTKESTVGVNCLVRFGNNYYSAPCEYAGKGVSIRIYANKVVLAVDGKAIGEHERSFDKGRFILEPLHYLPLLERKPGALRNGRPFLNWELPAPIRQVWEYLKRYTDWDRQMSELLLTIPRYGLEALSVACALALEEKAVSQSTIMNYLTRLTEDAGAAEVSIPEKLRLKEAPRSDCALYNQLLCGVR
jgi:transposase